MLTLGVFAGSVLWWATLAFGATRLRRGLGPTLLDSLARLMALAILLLRGAAPASRALQDGENALSAQLRGLLAVAEAYPQLRAGESFLGLQKRLAEVENHLQMARRYYNGTVRDYNTVVESFPSNVVAGA